MLAFDLTETALVNLTGIVLAVVFGIIPPVKRWFDTLGEWRPAFMAIALLLTAFGYQTVACRYIIVPCVTNEIEAMVFIWLMAYGTNQGVWKVFIKPAQYLYGLRSRAASKKTWG